MTAMTLRVTLATENTDPAFDLFAGEEFTGISIQDSTAHDQGYCVHVQESKTEFVSYDCGTIGEAITLAKNLYSQKTA
jgi:hypothetical protein